VKSDECAALCWCGWLRLPEARPKHRRSAAKLLTKEEAHRMPWAFFGSRYCSSPIGFGKRGTPLDDH
jgi:hypothetical protein